MKSEISTVYLEKVKIDKILDRYQEILNFFKRNPNYIQFTRSTMELIDDLVASCVGGYDKKRRLEEIGNNYGYVEKIQIELEDIMYKGNFPRTIVDKAHNLYLTAKKITEEALRKSINEKLKPTGAQK